MISFMSWIKPDEDEMASGSRTASLGGYLWKLKQGQRMLVPQWNKRWFSIEGKYLRYYEYANSEEYSGSIDLTKVECVQRVESMVQGAFSFCITCPERKYILRATSNSEVSKWVRAIRSQADLARGGYGMGILFDAQDSRAAPMAGKGKRMNSAGKSLENELEQTLERLNQLERGVLSAPSSARVRQESKESKESQDEKSASEFDQQRVSFRVVNNNKDSLLPSPSKRETRKFQFSEDPEMYSEELYVRTASSSSSSSLSRSRDYNHQRSSSQPIIANSKFQLSTSCGDDEKGGEDTTNNNKHNSFRPRSRPSSSTASTLSCSRPPSAEYYSDRSNNNSFSSNMMMSGSGRSQSQHHQHHQHQQQQHQHQVDMVDLENDDIFSLRK